jgi:hypothetical protein
VPENWQRTVSLAVPTWQFDEARRLSAPHLPTNQQVPVFQEQIALGTRDAFSMSVRCRQANESIRQIEEVDVLKITRTETPTEETWILQGRLVGLWVSEMRRSWKRTHATDNSLKCIVDLCDVTFIDKKGERLLQTMSKEGVQFIARGIYMKHLLQEMCGR